MRIEFVMPLLASLLACTLVGCSRSKSGELQGISYRLTLDPSYRLADLPEKEHEQVWYADGADAPIVSIYVGPTPSTAGQEPRCSSSHGIGWSDGLLFFPDAFDRRQSGKSASMTACSASHPSVTVTCSVYFRDGRMEQSLAEQSLAPCRSLVLD